MFSTAARTLKLLVLTAFSVIFVVFAASNHEVVSISLFPLPYTVELPKFLLAVICLFTGVLMTLLVMGIKIAKTRHQFFDARKRASALEGELKGLKAKNTLPTTLIKTP